MIDRPDVPPRFEHGATCGFIATAFLVAMFITALILAVRNLRLGRADVRGAFRVTLLTMACSFLGSGILISPDRALPDVLADRNLGHDLLRHSHCRVLLGLEPIIRRRQPEWLTSWARLLEGQWLDSRVGRDFLIGLAGGLLMLLTGALIKMGPARAGDYQAAAVGGWLAFSLLLRTSAAITMAFLLLLSLVVAQIVLRRKWLGWLIWVPVTALFLISPFNAAGFGLGLLRAAVLAALIRIGGLWSVAVALFAYVLMNDEYLTTQIGAWYGGVTVTVLLAVGVLLAWGLIASLRGRPSNDVNTAMAGEAASGRVFGHSRDRVPPTVSRGHSPDPIEVTPCPIPSRRAARLRIFVRTALAASLLAAPAFAASPAGIAGPPRLFAKTTTSSVPKNVSGVSLTPSWSVDGTVDGGRYGGAVAAAGDVNNDGYSDVLVSEPNDPDGGRVHLYLGSPSGLQSTGWNPGGFDPGSRFGTSVACAGDVNGDGYDDVVIGDPGAWEVRRPATSATAVKCTSIADRPRASWLRRRR